MKRITLLIILFCTLFCACTTLNKSKEGKNFSISTGTAIENYATGGAATVSGGTVDPVVPDNKKNIRRRDDKVVKLKTCTVLDETGKKRKLKLEKINIADVAVDFQTSDITSKYLQVQDGHCYYMKSDGLGNYTIYQDQGNEIGKFTIKSGYVSEFMRYGNIFYAILDHELFNPGMGRTEIDRELAYIDLKKKSAVVIYNILDMEPLFMYQNYFYYTYFYMDNMPLLKCVVQQGRPEGSVLPATEARDKADTDSYTLIDGKLYYGVQKKGGRDVILYSFDLKSGKEKIIFQYKRKTDTAPDIDISIDDTYLYCQEYLIPLQGGKIIAPFKRCENSIRYTYNKKYIYYIDKDHKIRRIDKKTLQDICISDMKVMGLECTNDTVYVRKYYEPYQRELEKREEEYEKIMNTPDDDYVWEDEEDEEDDEEHEIQSSDDPRGCDLYCMDLDGRHKKRLQSYPK